MIDIENVFPQRPKSKPTENQPFGCVRCRKLPGSAYKFGLPKSHTHQRDAIIKRRVSRADSINTICNEIVGMYVTECYKF